jgi:hypothetical protein
MASGNIISAMDFSRQVEVADLAKLSIRQFKLHCMLGGDIEFSHTVLGHQSCSAHILWLICHSNLFRLRKDRDDTSAGELRTDSCRN